MNPQLMSVVVGLLVGGSVLTVVVLLIRANGEERPGDDNGERPR